MSIVKETMEFVKSKDEEIGAALEREYQRQKRWFRKIMFLRNHNLLHKETPHQVPFCN